MLTPELLYHPYLIIKQKSHGENEYYHVCFPRQYGKEKISRKGVSLKEMCPGNITQGQHTSTLHLSVEIFI